MDPMLMIDPAPLFGHRGRDHPGQQERRGNVDGERIAHQLLGHVRGWRRCDQHRGVVHQDVDAAAGRGGRLIGESAHVRAAGAQVGGDERGRTSAGFDSVDDASATGSVAAGDDDGSSVLCQGGREGRAKAAS